jgi:hypothetical protein
MRTRGSLGRLFKPWPVPEVPALAPGQGGTISKVLIRLQRDLMKELKSEFKKSIPQAKTSAVGRSSDQTSKNTHRKADIERRRMEAEHERVAEIFRR